MFKLRTGYLLSGLVTGLILLFSFVTTLPDGKLHVVFCNVGQGDAAYVRFPDGRDMLVDGGPNNKVINCLGKYMPFWDRTIDMIVLSHPQKDHLGGLVDVLNRFTVNYFVHSRVDNTTEGYTNLIALVHQKKVTEKFVTTGDDIDIGKTRLSVVWPTKSQIAQMSDASAAVLGVSTDKNVNDASVVLHLRYGTFDVLFPGDADQNVDPDIVSQTSDIPDGLEVLKVPHHGSKTGMTDGFLNWLYSQSSMLALRSKATKGSLSIISVGKNSYGHPAPETISQLTSRGIKILRTDINGDIEVNSDGKTWSYTLGL
jgi:competence protein ComEC